MLSPARKGIGIGGRQVRFCWPMQPWDASPRRALCNLRDGCRAPVEGFAMTHAVGLGVTGNDQAARFEDRLGWDSAPSPIESEVPA